MLVCPTGKKWKRNKTGKTLTDTLAKKDQTLTGKPGKPGGIGPPGPSCGGMGPNGLGADGFCKNKRTTQMLKMSPQFTPTLATNL